MARISFAWLLGLIAAIAMLALPLSAFAKQRAALDPAHETAARLQTLLARANFSPGLIDGKPGRKTKIAIEHFQQASGLEVTGAANERTLTALGESAKLGPDEPWTMEYRFSQADKDLITGPIPEDWNERAALEVSGYADAAELLAERGWCSVDMVIALNPDANLEGLRSGDRVVLPDIRGKAIPKLDRVEIELEEKLVLGYGPDGKNVFLTHCSVAKDVEKRPVGELHVKVIADAPDYTFDPKGWPEVTNVDRKLRIAPGPRNPVGAAWVGLDRPGYGMHGTVRPQDIGKTGSHGCFRLANWEALRVAHSARVGMVVVVRE